MTSKLVALAALGAVILAAYSSLEVTRPDPVEVSHFGESRPQIFPPLGGPDARLNGGDNSCHVYNLYARGTVAVGRELIAVGEAAEAALTRLSRTPTMARWRYASVLGVASWYGPGFYGHRTSTGEIYRAEQLTAASTTIPLGSRVMVNNLDNGRSVEVRINDHGPFVKGRKIDLSRAAARVLGMLESGIAHVRMDVLCVPEGSRPMRPSASRAGYRPALGPAALRADLQYGGGRDSQPRTVVACNDADNRLAPLRERD